MARQTMVFNNSLAPWHNSTPCSLLSPSESPPCTRTRAHTNTHELTGRWREERERERAEQPTAEQGGGSIQIVREWINTASSRASQGVRRPNGRLGLLPGSIDWAITLPLSCLPWLTSPSSSACCRKTSGGVAVTNEAERLQLQLQHYWALLISQAAS